MPDYQSIYTGVQIDGAVERALNLETSTGQSDIKIMSQNAVRSALIGLTSGWNYSNYKFNNDKTTDDEIAYVPGIGTGPILSFSCPFSIEDSYIDSPSSNGLRFTMKYTSDSTPKFFYSLPFITGMFNSLTGEYRLPIAHNDDITHLLIRVDKDGVVYFKRDTTDTRFTFYSTQIPYVSEEISIYFKTLI